jgi:cell division protein FtsB
MSARGEAVARARLRVTGRAVILVALILLLAAAGTGVFRQFLDQRARIERLERNVRALEAERGRLEDRIRQLNDPAHLEALARECLGMVRPGEIRFVVPEEKPADSTSPSAC